jgi:ABC-type multidrug transport system fused ATPase/permease subunit
MSDKPNLLSSGASIAGRNKRYVVWFFVLNFVLASMGAAAFRAQVSTMLDRSLYADGVLHGFDLGVFLEMLGRPEFGPMHAGTAPGMVLAGLFFVLTLIFLPGVFLGYASNYRISREDFFRACGKNLWRFVRLAILFAIVAGIVGGILGGIETALAKVANENSSYEKLPFYIQLIGSTIIFLALTKIRIWFDLAEADVVIADQRAVRKSLGKTYRQTRGNRVRLFGAYVAISIVALLVLAIGLVIWNGVVPPASVFGALLIGQLILVLLLATRFWQRAVAVSFYSTALAAETPVENQPAPVSLTVAATPQGDGI